MQDREASELEGLAAGVVEQARRRGADVAEATARRGFDLNVRVRLGEPELVEEAGHRSVSLRLIRDQRVALSSTSDISPEGLDRLVADALELSELTEQDEFASPADPADLAKPPHPDLDLFDPSVGLLSAEEALALATLAERVALASDPRLKLSEGATVSRSTGMSAMVLSGGFAGVQQGSYASLVVTPVAEDEGGKKRRGYYWTAHRHRSNLESPEAVGKEAARRTLAKLAARKVPTTEAPIVFDPDVARSLLGSFASCILGGALWRKTSYLLEREGSVVASPLVTLVDDPTIPRAPGSRPYDGEGLRSRRNVVVEAGILKTFLLDCYSARKLGRRSTGSAARGGGSVSASTSNFLLENGKLPRDQIISITQSGLYVTELMGFGFNAVTGDFSRGAAGFWIDGGQLAFPVGEVTISSNLDTMLKNVDAVGDDLVLKSSTASPTLRVSSMTISGT